MKKLLEWLDGRKAKLLAIVGIILGAVTRMGYVDPQIATDIMSILTVLAGGAAVATDRTLGVKYRAR